MKLTMSPTFTSPSGRPCHINATEKDDSGNWWITIRYEDGDKEFKRLPYEVVEPYLPE